MVSVKVFIESRFQPQIRRWSVANLEELRSLVMSIVNKPMILEYKDENDWIMLETDSEWKCANEIMLTKNESVLLIRATTEHRRLKLIHWKGRGVYTVYNENLINEGEGTKCCRRKWRKMFWRRWLERVQKSQNNENDGFGPQIQENYLSEEKPKEDNSFEDPIENEESAISPIQHGHKQCEFQRKCFSHGNGNHKFFPFNGVNGHSFQHFSEQPQCPPYSQVPPQPFQTQKHCHGRRNCLGERFRQQMSQIPNFNIPSEQSCYSGNHEGRCFGRKNWWNKFMDE